MKSDMRQSSIVLRISMALAGIITLAAATMLTSYWIADRADSDAQAINLAGSLRMNSYKLAMLLHQTPVPEPAVSQTRERLANTWAHPLLHELRARDPALAEAYGAAERHWQALDPALMAGQIDTATLDRYVDTLEALVLAIQNHAQDNARTLRRMQIGALILMLSLTAIAIYWLKTKVAQPLTDLTRELQRSNTALQFLYETANTIIKHPPEGLDYGHIVTRLSELANTEDLELCLMTSAGDTPYLQVTPSHSVHQPCVSQQCYSCLKGELVTGYSGSTLDEDGAVVRHSFPLVYEQHHYGVLVCRLRDDQALDTWQRQLIQSVADQLAVALSLQQQEDNARRLSLIHERTVIARELHDSLAQALSYLKIQVTRLNRALAKDDKATLESVSAELHEGLGSAYRQLRELLTTFRLKVDEPGLINALQTSVDQLSAQTDMHITLACSITHLPLTPNEEIHLLQIVREATQNAIHHSEGQQVAIRLHQSDDKQIQVRIEDDGIGIANAPEKPNHYGLTIMRERAHSLGGELHLSNRVPTGTRVYFAFVPRYLHRGEGSSTP
ncbi:ATP-binding protein [Marinimicrobium alkaliphilum]|uniref:ATP-binding protein n=1 Tax=Marinimicrobium alkaliphilum TaxID=2202654 RepID=UPI0018E06DFA|nr:ATP-binding protein [Marinimicrobium alkaliphilum]